MMSHTKNDILVLPVGGCAYGQVNLLRQSKYLLIQCTAALEASSGKSDQDKGLILERKKIMMMMITSLYSTINKTISK